MRAGQSCHSDERVGELTFMFTHTVPDAMPSRTKWPPSACTAAATCYRAAPVLVACGAGVEATPVGTASSLTTSSIQLRVATQGGTRAVTRLSDVVVWQDDTRGCFDVRCIDHSRLLALDRRKDLFECMRRILSLATTSATPFVGACFLAPCSCADDSGDLADHRMAHVQLAPALRRAGRV